MKSLIIKQLQLIAITILFAGSTYAQCPAPVVCSGGTNGDVVSIKLGGRGGTITRATFGYDAGIILDGTTKVNSTLTVTGSTSLSSLSVPGNAIFSGNVGIGITPATKLDVNGAVNISGVLGFGSTSASSSSTLSVTSGSNGSIVNMNVNGRGGLKTMATFGYDYGVTLIGSVIDLNAASSLSFKTNGAERVTVTSSGNVGIGCTTPASKLAVNGKIQATEVEIKSAPCSDFVFEKNYKLMSLSEVEKFVITNKHLPEVPSAKEFAANGYSIHQMDDLLLRKVEELTLYVIELKKENEALKKEVESLK